MCIYIRKSHSLKALLLAFQMYDIWYKNGMPYQQSTFAYFQYMNRDLWPIAMWSHSTKYAQMLQTLLISS